MRKILIALVALASVASLSACGTSSGSDGSSDDTTTTEAEKATTTTTEAEGVPVDEWAQGFCGNFKTWLGEIESASTEVKDKVDPADAGSAQTAISELFASASASTQTLITSIEDGSAPDIDDGDAFVDDLIGKFQDFDDAAKAAQTDVEALKTDDLETFETEATALVTQYQDEITKIGDSFAALDAEYPSEELSSALDDNCTA